MTGRLSFCVWIKGKEGRAIHCPGPLNHRERNKNKRKNNISFVFGWATKIFRA